MVHIRFALACGQVGDLLLARAGLLARLAVRRQSRFDGLAARAEGIDLPGADVRQLEAPISMCQAHAIAQLLRLQSQLVAVHRAHQHLLPIEIRLLQRTPLAIGALRHVQHHRMCVQVGVLGTAQVMAKRRHHQVAARLALRHTLFRDAVSGQAFGVGQRARHRRFVGVDQPGVTTDQRLHRHAFRRREGEVGAAAPPLGGVMELAAIGHPAV